MKKMIILAALFLLLPGDGALAHRPIFSEKTARDPNTAVVILQPDLSQVIYREITDESREVWLTLEAGAGFRLFIQIGVPVLERLKDFRPAVLVAGPGLAGMEVSCQLPEGTGAIDFPTDQVTQPRLFHEHFTGTDSWILRSETVVLPRAGRYYVAAHVPSGAKGKLWLSVGKKESFGLAEWARFGEWKKKIRAFHEVNEAGRKLRIPLISNILDLFEPTKSRGTQGEKTDPNGVVLGGPDRLAPAPESAREYRCNDGHAPAAPTDSAPTPSASPSAPANEADRSGSCHSHRS